MSGREESTTMNAGSRLTLSSTASVHRNRSVAPAAKSKQVKFIEVQPLAPAIAPEVGTIELVVGDVRIVVRGRVETEALAPVLAALE